MAEVRPIWEMESSTSAATGPFRIWGLTVGKPPVPKHMNNGVALAGRQIAAGPFEPYEELRRPEGRALVKLRDAQPSKFMKKRGRRLRKVVNNFRQN